MDHFADRLLAACEAKGSPICVGLDPVLDRLPSALQSGVDSASAQDAADRLYRFCLQILEVVAPLVPCVKPQLACFERYLWPGLAAYHRLVQEARNMGLMVIGDAKRGDIGISAAHYAAGDLADNSFADLGCPLGPDALTVNSYLGIDALSPFIQVAHQQAKGLFALVRTSNPGGDALQGLPLADGRSVAQAVGEMIAQVGDAYLGQSGYSLLGAVVGATKSHEARSLRLLMPRQLFLVPGFGAQGGTAQDVRACFNPQGNGAIITASRSVVYAFEKNTQVDWPFAIQQAAQEMKGQIRAILG